MHDLPLYLAVEQPVENTDPEKYPKAFRLIRIR